MLNEIKSPMISPKQINFHRFKTQNINKTFQSSSSMYKMQKSEDHKSHKTSNAKLST